VLFSCTSSGSNAAHAAQATTLYSPAFAFNLVDAQVSMTAAQREEGDKAAELLAKWAALTMAQTGERATPGRRWSAQPRLLSGEI